MCNASNSANIDNTAPLFHNLVTRVFPAGNGDKMFGHVNDVYLKTAAYTGMRYSIYRGYSIFLLNMAFISPSEVENIYIS